MSPAWEIFTGSRHPHDGIHDLPPAPNWRRFTGGPVLDAPQHQDPDSQRRLGITGIANLLSPHHVRLVNAALYLRRPLLVTGRPGTGKSTLAYAVARELKLGPVLEWPISSRSTVQKSLYSYDAIGRLHDENFAQIVADPNERRTVTDIGRYLRLGPLGTALLPYRTPRVLLIDEIDKCDVDLPNDLLHILETGMFDIDELARLPQDYPPVSVRTADKGDQRAVVTAGSVQCAAFPFIVMTSNGERDFPSAFLRRVLRLDLSTPTYEQLEAMVRAHLGPDAAAETNGLIDNFLNRQSGGHLSADQLMNLIYLSRHRSQTSWPEVVDALLRTLPDADEW